MTPDNYSDMCTQNDINNKNPQCPKGNLGAMKLKCGSSGWKIACEACTGDASGKKGGDQEWCSKYCNLPLDCSKIKFPLYKNFEQDDEDSIQPALEQEINTRPFKWKDTDKPDEDYTDTPNWFADGRKNGQRSSPNSESGDKYHNPNNDRFLHESKETNEQAQEQWGQSGEWKHDNEDSDGLVQRIKK